MDYNAFGLAIVARGARRALNVWNPPHLNKAVLAEWQELRKPPPKTWTPSMGHHERLV